ncbi:hypothetical protein OG21DRAFT_747004 [Imleria badia]|nr:hypothetical protein OG21DRAFT_747004 [Imleria badia]
MYGRLIGVLKISHLHCDIRAIRPLFNVPHETRPSQPPRSMRSFAEGLVWTKPYSPRAIPQIQQHLHRRLRSNLLFPPNGLDPSPFALEPQDNRLQKTYKTSSGIDPTTRPLAEAATGASSTSAPLPAGDTDMFLPAVPTRTLNLTLEQRVVDLGLYAPHEVQAAAPSPTVVAGSSLSSIEYATKSSAGSWGDRGGHIDWVLVS